MSILSNLEIEQLYFSTLECNDLSAIAPYNEQATLFNRGKTKHQKVGLLTEANYDSKREEAFGAPSEAPMVVINKKPEPKPGIALIPDLWALENPFLILIKSKYDLSQIDALVDEYGLYNQPTEPGTLEKPLNQQEVIVRLNKEFEFNQNQIVEITGYAKANVAWTFSKHKLTNTTASKRPDGKTQKEIIVQMYDNGCTNVADMAELTGIKKNNIAWYFSKLGLSSVRKPAKLETIADIDAQIAKLQAMKLALGK